MSSAAVANPPVESKSARKKKAKAELAAPATPTQDQHAGSEVNGSEAGGESNYVKELQKNVRNVTKKLNLMQKVDTIIADNPDSTLDELVSAKKINADQRAQALKKPQLQAQLAQLEEQLAQYKKVDQEYQQKVTAEKELLQSTHKAELEKLRDVVQAEAAAEEIKNLKKRYLTLSKFLHTAAAKRQLEEPDTDERQAFEGVLLLVYGGDANAVDAIEKLVEGSEDIVNSVEGLPTSVSFSQIREASLSRGTEEAGFTEPETTTAEPEATATTTDPTIANAGLTEIEDNAAPVSSSEPAEASTVPAAASIGADASNAAADEQWDQAAKSTDDPLTESFEIVSRDQAETEPSATPVAETSTQSWADDTPAETVAATPAASNGSDGFHEVHHQRGGRARGDGRGPFRGRGRGGDRGRGGNRGDGRGRGGQRGGYRGRGGPRGDAAPAAS